MAIRSLAIALRAVLSVMEVVIVVRILCEFKAIKRDSKPFKFLLLISEPLLNPVRSILEKQSGDKKPKFDLSPFVVLILLYIIRIILKNSFLV
jgi:uncharacterized protein YggT (Ycf19 family)